MDISDLELRKRLERFGYDVGPITDTTRLLYESKLKSFETGNPSPKRGGRKSIDRSQKVSRKSLQNSIVRESTNSPSSRTRRRSVREAPILKDSNSDTGASITDEQLSKELRQYGFDAGPINRTTKKMYLSKLESLKKAEDSKIKKSSPEVKKKSSATLKAYDADSSSDYDEIEGSEEFRHFENEPGHVFDKNGKTSDSGTASSLRSYSFLNYSDTIASTVDRSFKSDYPNTLVKGRRSIGVPSSSSTLPNTPRRSMSSFTPATKTSKRFTLTPRQTLSMRSSTLEGFSDSDGEMLPSSRARPNSYSAGINRNIPRNRVEKAAVQESVDYVDSVTLNEQWESWKNDVISVIRKKSQLVVAVSIFLLILLFILYCGTRSSEKHNFSVSRSIRNDDSIICKGNEEYPNCVKQANVENAVQLLAPLRGILQEHSDAYLCGNPDFPSPRMAINDVIHSISANLKMGEAEVKKRMRDLVILIMHYPHWSIDYGFGEDGSLEKIPENVRWLAAKDTSTPLLCQFMSFSWVALRGFTVIVLIVTIAIGITYAIWWLWNNQKSKEAQINVVVDQVIGVLKAQKSKDPRNPYLPVSLIQSKVFTELNDRIANKKLWGEVVDVIDQQEGMIASGRTNINGVEHAVWCWQGE